MQSEPAGIPASRDIRWPAEWEPHAATWISWPHNRETWPGKFSAIADCFATLVRTIAQFEPVNVIAGGAPVMADARQHVGPLSNVTFFDIETNDAWCRDHGPIFVKKGSGLFSAANESVEQKRAASPVLVDWEYNAWGGKYPPFDRDNAVASRIADQLGLVRFAPGIVLEGGALDGNGQGTILTTASCLLNANRNANLTQADAEQYLSDYLGARQVLWLARGELAGDDTDGHVDQLARFVNPTTIVAACEEDASDENYEPLTANFDQLQTMSDQHGKPLHIIPLPLPRPKFHNGQRLPASYCNFYLANGCVIVPQFDDPADAEARCILEERFPDREVIGLPSLDLITGLGSFHCVTQQQPA